MLQDLPKEYHDRLAKLQKLQDKGINPFPAESDKEQSILDCFNSEEGASVHTAGRIMLKREMGKLIFAHIQDETHKMQIVLEKGIVDDDSFKTFEKLIDVADFLEISGDIFITKKGEKSILIKEWKLLSKALLPLPEKWHGIKDEDIRYRKRYLDFITNPETKDLILKKSKFWKSARKFLEDKNFTEIETPYLEVTPGGAEARPFLAHHNDFDIDVYFRISVGELWQKRMMVGGFEKTFEIGRVFRNEGSSPNHLQEFTNCEFYWSYADYRDGMKLTKELYQYLAQETFGTLQFKVGDHEIDLSQETWPEIDFGTTIKEKTGIDIFKSTDEEILNKLKELKISTDGKGRGKMLDNLWKHCRKTILGPAFLVGVPVILEPLAKKKEDNPELVQRFQIILAGTEIGKGFSELNDPLDQLERFQAQQALRDSGDDEAQMEDTDFVEALMHGMPPTFGFGFGQRLFAMMAGVPIRETETFPLMKPENPMKED